MRPESRIPLKPDAFQILRALAYAPLHGYGLLKELARSTWGQMVLLRGTVLETGLTALRGT